MPKQRKAWLDALRALAMVLVMTGHAAHQVGPYFSWTTPIKIPLFFAISGYLFHMDGYENFRQFVKAKARRLLIPYIGLALLTNAIMLAVNVVLLQKSAAEVLQAQGLDLLTGEKLWFIPCLMWIELMLYGLHRAAAAPGFRRIATVWRHVLLTGIAVLIARLIMVSCGPLPWHVDTALLMVFFAELGYGLRQVEGKMARLSFSWTIVAMGAYLALCAAQIALGVSKINVDGNRWPFLPLNLLTCTVGVAALFMLFPRLPIPGCVAYVGRNTLIYYAFHQIIQMGITLVCRIVLPGLPDPQGCLWMAMLIVLAACFLCAIPSALIHRYCPWLAGQRRGTVVEKAG